MWAAIKEHFKNRFSEWIVGIALLVWGVIVTFNTDLFANTTVFYNMQRIAPQPVWGAAAIFIGAVRLVFLFINGSWRRSAHLRAAGSALSACLWAAIWGSYLNVDNVLPNLATIGALLALDFYSLWFAAEDAKHSDVFTRIARATPNDNLTI